MTNAQEKRFKRVESFARVVLQGYAANSHVSLFHQDAITNVWTIAEKMEVERARVIKTISK